MAYKTSISCVTPPKENSIAVSEPVASSMYQWSSRYSPTVMVAHQISLGALEPDADLLGLRGL